YGSPKPRIVVRFHVPLPYKNDHHLVVFFISRSTRTELRSRQLQLTTRSWFDSKERGRGARSSERDADIP
ncbi:MAG: hypothetical protein V4678_01585, partial [Patescibacteria group bacterium]